MDTDIVKIMYKLGKYQECMGNGTQLQSLGRVYWYWHVCACPVPAPYHACMQCMYFTLINYMPITSGWLWCLWPGKLTGAALSLNMSRVSKQREWSDAVSKEARYERSVVCRFVWKVEGLGSAILSSRIVELDRWLLTGEFMREVYELSVGGVRVRKCAFGIQICSGKGKWEKRRTG